MPIVSGFTNANLSFEKVKKDSFCNIKRSFLALKNILYYAPQVDVVKNCAKGTILHVYTQHI